MECKRCKTEFDPLQVKDELRLFQIEYDGRLCYECAVEQLYKQKFLVEFEPCVPQTNLGLIYKKAIDERTKLVESLLEQLYPNSKRVQELSEELVTLQEMQDVPPEDVVKDPWVLTNIKIEI